MNKKVKWVGILSTAERNHIGLIRVRQNNVNSEVLGFEIIDGNGEPYDLKNRKVLFCTYFDKLAPVEQYAEVIEDGKIVYTMNQHDMQKPVRINFAYFKILDEKDNLVDTTQNFSYDIMPSIESKCMNSEPYIIRLEEVLDGFLQINTDAKKELEQIIIDFNQQVIDQQQNFELWFESIREILESVDPGGVILNELVDFRYSELLDKHFSRMKDRAKFWDDEIANRGVNPIWFGALPDTGIPAQDAFKKALLKSNVLCVTQGTYKITGTIELPDNAKIICFGKVVFDCDTGLRVFFADDKKGIAFMNFEMTEKGTVSSTNIMDGSKGIYLNKCSDFLIQDVKTSQFGAWGIVAVDSKKFTITRSEGNKSVRQSGIAVSNCFDYTISHSTCSENAYSGIIAEPAGKNGRILDNICTGNTQGILIKDDGEGTLVSRNTVNLNKEYGLYTEYSKGILYSENISKFNGDSTRKNVGFGFYGKNTEDVSLLYNDIQQNNAHAIYFENVDGFITKKPVIKGNTIIRNCLTYNLDNQGEMYIRKATDLTCAENSIDPTGRAYVIEAGTTIMDFNQSTIQRLNTDKKGFSELVPFSRNLQKVTVNFSSSLRQIIFSKPFNMRVVHVEARCMLKFSSSIELKINGVARLVTKVTDPNREYSSANQLPINYSTGEDINLQIANTINNDYIIYYTLDIYYI